MSQGQETDSQKTGEGSVLGFFFFKEMHLSNNDCSQFLFSFFLSF